MFSVFLRRFSPRIVLTGRRHCSHLSGNMPRLSIRSVPGEERMQISFIFCADGEPGSGSSKERVFNLDRLQTEELGKTLMRINANVAKAVNKKKKKNRSPTEAVNTSPESEGEGLIAELFDSNNTRVGEEVPNKDAWKEGTELVVCNTRYNVQINPPSVHAIILPKVIMVGFPLYPRIEAEFVDLDKCVITWYRENSITNNNVSIVTPCCGTSTDPINKPYAMNWTEVHKGLVYTPLPTDLGHRLQILCTPADGIRFGENISVVTSEVTNGPRCCPFENRHELTQKRAGHGSFRVLTYNILADCCADTDYSREHCYPYCPLYALEADYRKQLLIRELKGYKADLLFLQEVDWRLFKWDLEPALQLQGMAGRLKLKYPDHPEGEAIFWHKDKFRCIGESDLHLSEALQKDPAYTPLYERVCTNEHLMKKVIGRKTILQTCTLESLEDTDHCVVVATTHLFFQPRASNVRLVQTAMCMQHIAHIVSQLEKQHGRTPSVVFGGDFNSTPNHGVLEFITKGYIPADHSDWCSAGQEEFISNIDLHHPLQMDCASGIPQYTNFVRGFAGCLDYIFISSNSLHTSQVVPLPTHSEVTAHTGLPNPVFPSDHLPLICDITRV